MYMDFNAASFVTEIEMSINGELVKYINNLRCIHTVHCHATIKQINTSVNTEKSCHDKLKSCHDKLLSGKRKMKNMYRPILFLQL